MGIFGYVQAVSIFGCGVYLPVLIGYRRHLLPESRIRWGGLPRQNATRSEFFMGTLRHFTKVEVPRGNSASPQSWSVFVSPDVSLKDLERDLAFTPPSTGIRGCKGMPRQKSGISREQRSGIKTIQRWYNIRGPCSQN